MILHCSGDDLSSLCIVWQIKKNSWSSSAHLFWRGCCHCWCWYCILYAWSYSRWVQEFHLIHVSEADLNNSSCGAYSTVMLPPAPNPTVCIIQYPSWNWGRYSVIPLVALQGVMCILAIYQSFRQSFQLYKATERWQLTQYFQLLLNQGILYFSMWVFTLSITPMLSIYGLMDI